MDSRGAVFQAPNSEPHSPGFATTTVTLSRLRSLPAGNAQMPVDGCLTEMKSVTVPTLKRQTPVASPGGTSTQATSVRCACPAVPVLRAHRLPIGRMGATRNERLPLMNGVRPSPILRERCHAQQFGHGPRNEQQAHQDISADLEPRLLVAAEGG